MTKTPHIRRAVWAAAAAFLVLLLTAGHASAQPDVTVIGQGYTCSTAIDVGTLTIVNPPGDGLRLAPGCTGSVERLEISGVRNGDAIKIQNPSGTPDDRIPHDLTVHGGYATCSGPPTDGTHQDGLQAMGGRNIRFLNLVVDCYGGGGGNWFINRAVGSWTPTGVVCVGCLMGPHHGTRSHTVNIARSLRSGLRDSIVCTSERSSATPVLIQDSAVEPVNENNRILPRGAPECASLDAMLAAVGDAEPEPPLPAPGPCDQACVDAFEATIAGLEAENTALTAQLADANAELDRLADLLDRIAQLLDEALNRNS